MSGLMAMVMIWSVMTVMTIMWKTGFVTSNSCLKPVVVIGARWQPHPRCSTPQSHRATEPQSHRASSPLKRRPSPAFSKDGHHLHNAWRCPLATIQYLGTTATATAPAPAPAQVFGRHEQVMVRSKYPGAERIAYAVKSTVQSQVNKMKSVEER